MISALAAVLLAFGATAHASVDCSAVGPKAAAWLVAETSVFTMHVPSDYQYQPISVSSGFAGKWVRRGKKGQSAIDFVTGRASTFQRQWATSHCKETIGGRQVRVETGIGPTGRYFVRLAWLDALPDYPNSYLEIWADTADLTEQLEALSAIRTVTLKSNAGA